MSLVALGRIPIGSRWRYFATGGYWLSATVEAHLPNGNVRVRVGYVTAEWKPDWFNDKERVS